MEEVGGGEVRGGGGGRRSLGSRCSPLYPWVSPQTGRPLPTRDSRGSGLRPGHLGICGCTRWTGILLQLELEIDLDFELELDQS